MVLYLKYRPQSLDDLIGQEAVKQTLLNSFNSQKLAHAYLFVGPRGTGKTSTARILAKMVNCTAETKPCNLCDACISITNGSNMDLIEIDGASNRGIDDVRLLREGVKLSPTASKKKIYIIDEVHMLTTEAFNALLKTLEEPPEHVMFILATTEVSKIPQTILSRVQKLDFRLAGVPDLITALQKVAKAEKIKIDDASLSLIAKASEGSFRDAVKLLDQISAGSNELTAATVSDLLKSTGFETILSLTKALADRNAAGALSQVVELIQKGANTKELILSLMEVMRNLVYLNNGLESLVRGSYDSKQFPAVAELAGHYSTQDLAKSLNYLQQALENLKTASIVSLPLEIAVVEICHNFSVIPAAAEIQIEEKVTVIASEPTAAPVILVDAHNEPIRPDSPQIGDIAKLHEKWTVVLETIRPFNYSLEALLRSVKILQIENGLVILEVPYSFHQRILESPKSKDLLESVIAEVLSKPIKISTVLGVRPQRIEDIANVEIAQDDEIISLASEIFNGKLID